MSMLDGGHPQADAPIRHSWSESDRFVPRAFVRPLQRLMDVEAAGGGVMLLAAVLALVWANSPWWEGYERLWETPLAIELGDVVHLDLTLREWVNDALMAVFFFLAGLEIKRELVLGELRDPRAAALPAVAALGGMVLPALLYTVVNVGAPGANGWGIPMATDIAFAVGIVALLGSRVPTGAKLFLLTLAIVDDLGAILVIAVFYTSDLAFSWLAVALAAVAVAYLIQRVDVRSILLYAALALLCWYALHESGVHATLAGVAFGLLTPTWSFFAPSRFAAHARELLAEIEATELDGRLTHEEYERTSASTREIIRLATESESPLDRLESRLAPWVGFVIVPVFALANAGVRLAGGIDGDGATRVVLGVVLGLVVGKTLGVFSATWLAVRLGLGVLPRAASWRHMLGLSVAAGIGFTVALFVASLSFDDPVLTDAAKVGILGASLVAGILAYLVLRTCRPQQLAPEEAAPPGTAPLQPVP